MMEKYIGKHTIILATIAGATIIAATGNEGWGWLVLIAILLIL
jgi:hypothetical protein